jgi:hypothetical protein
VGAVPRLHIPQPWLAKWGGECVRRSRAGLTETEKFTLYLISAPMERP